MKNEQIGDRPIEEQYLQEMRNIASTLDKVFNPQFPDRKTGFVLMVFPFGGPEGRINYISNANRDDVLATLKQQVAAFEGRFHEG